ncbi:hypothetical protein [Halobacillus mangrovi]|uniref:Uncharacterized protein n=1 Tax=Halobacillus mangrovi TaxID=402384 RepID=A0A1W5ZZW4_9BACI|nr:hypothetical protein [Halobacillus mangrovi]ARI78809.1 hypothetical protein HM131_19070 [Halobacillus mangrovi]
MNDFGINQPDCEQVKLLQKKRADREFAAALIKRMDKKVLDSINSLKNIEDTCLDTVGAIKDIKNMERVGDLYHIISKVSFWMDCLLEHDPIIKIKTIEEVDAFFNNIKSRRNHFEKK